MRVKIRPRRNRRNPSLRRLARETSLTVDDLILPLFVVPGQDRCEPIAGLPDVSRYSTDLLENVVDELACPAVLLFGVPDAPDKDDTGSSACNPDGLVPAAIRAIRAARCDLAIITDVCICAYTSHGHCGVLDDSGAVTNDPSLEVLSEMAQVHASAGADMVAPSAMMDGQVEAIRNVLDSNGYTATAIMAYSAKFASAFYGPFREAANSAPTFGDRSGYQLPVHNPREALRDALVDEKQGADWLMVKPALPYLDILYQLKAGSRLPVAAYQVSGEYVMLKRATRAAAFDEQRAVIETLTSIKRAGADAIITYYAQEASDWIAL